MSITSFGLLSASVSWWDKSINYEIIQGNEAWRFGLLFIVLIVILSVGRIGQYFIQNYAEGAKKKNGDNAANIFLNCLAKPFSIAVFALGLFICKGFVYFDEQKGINPAISDYWGNIAKAVAAIAFTYAIYKLVDVIEFYLLKLTGRTRTKLDDMLVPVVRKSLRVTIVIIAVLWIADGILGANIRAILLSAGVGGIAIALAAKETIANFFGSVTIFADRPFQIDDILKIGDDYATVEEVGFRSTRVRTFYGHLLTIPNSMMANQTVENISSRPFIRRVSNITITYDSGHTKAKKAVEIIQAILADIPAVNAVPQCPPRVYFNNFNDCSLNIYMSYWVNPPDYWLFFEINQRVNLDMMKRFKAEGIEFAFPTQTLYVNKD